MKFTCLLFALALAGGCKKDAPKEGGGGGGGGGKVASCLAESIQNCREYRGGNLALGTESLQKLCTAVVSSAKFSETACPTDKVIGSCAKREGKDFYYEGYMQSAQEIEAGCKQGGGTFSAK